MERKIVKQSPDRLAEYGEIAIAFRTTERLDLASLPELRPLPVAPFEKDYDSIPGSRPADLAHRFDLANWTVLAAYEGEQRSGGVLLAFRTPGVDMLEVRDDLAVVWDLRVLPSSRGRGIGRDLWRAAESWAKEHGAVELHVETQDINFVACRFYAAMGCRLLRVSPGAYPEFPDETQLLWSKAL